MARLACIGSLYIVMARVARRHRGHADRAIGGVHIVVAGFALNLLVFTMRLMRKHKLALYLSCLVGRLIAAYMAIGAICFELILMAALAVFMLADQIIRG